METQWFAIKENQSTLYWSGSKWVEDLQFAIKYTNDAAENFVKEILEHGVFHCSKRVFSDYTFVPLKQIYVEAA